MTDLNFRTEIESFPKIQHIIAGEGAITFTVKTLGDSTKLLWCISNFYVKYSQNDYNISSLFNLNESNKTMLEYLNPPKNNLINGKTLYVILKNMDDEDCINITNRKLLPIESSLGDLSTTMVLLNIIEGAVQYTHTHTHYLFIQNQLLQ